MPKSLSLSKKKPDVTCHSNPNVSCADCRLNTLCLPISLHIEEIDILDSIVKRGRPLQRSNYLFRANDEFKSVYAVRSGSFKTYTLSASGEEQITGFYLPGEILGMDGLNNDFHSNSAVALETSAICEIPFTRMEEISLTIPALQRRFFQLMSKEIAGDQQLLSLISRNTADERIASFLLSISARNHQRQLSPTSFNLSMSRTELANYLGLTIETTSRVFSRLNKKGLIKVDKKQIEIIDMDNLRKSAAA
ncbi:MAG: Crp/Fnr family transcriptional regulator [Alteromonadaceae bacterium]|nr:MAG: Crp/Fnr family transcriptional regulator [Alteromonadaceae bacterium]